MTDFPSRDALKMDSVITYPFSFGGQMGLAAQALFCLQQNNSFSAFSTSVLTANFLYLLPIILPTKFTVRMMGIRNGGTVSGNFDVGVHDYAGNLIAAAGSTAQATINTFQSVALSAPVTMEKDTPYYLGFVADNATGIFGYSNDFGSTGVSSLVAPNLGLMSVTGTFPLASVTPASNNIRFVPLLFLSARTVL